MNPAFLDDMSWAMAEVYGSVTDRLLTNIARHFKYANGPEDLMGSFQYQVRKLAELGQVNRESVDIIANSLEGADGVLRMSLELAIRDALKTVDPTLRKAAERGLLQGAGTTPPEVSPRQMQAFKAYYAQSADKLNLVNTVMLESTEDAYRACLSDVVNRIQRSQSILNAGAGDVVTGVSSWNQAMHDAVGKMVQNGLTGFIDHADRHWSPEAYVAMDIRTTMFNTARAAVWERAEDYGSDIYQVSTHNGARSKCYPWQGKLISRIDSSRDVPDLDGNMVHVYAPSETSYGAADGLFGVNCKHYPTPFIPGFSTLRGEPQSPEENAKTYEESQQQRALERKVRDEKLKLSVMQAQGADEEDIQKQKAKVRAASADVQAFCDETGRTRRRSREYTPVNAKFPPKDSYDPATFRTEQRDAISEWAKGPRMSENALDAVEVLQVEAEQTIGPKRADFSPAKSIQEAEAQARQYVVPGMGSVSYKGIDLEYANTCNRVLGDIGATYDVKALGSVQPMNMRAKIFRNSTAEAAYRWGGIGGDLFINPTYYKSKSAFAAHKAQIEQLTQKVLNSSEKLLAAATGVKREYVQALLNTKRQCVSQSYEFVEGTFVHECGHRLDDNLFRKLLIEAFGGSTITFSDSLSESMHRFGGNISGYAVASNQEYIAESFTAWWYGEGDKIDPVIKAVFEGAMKK